MRWWRWWLACCHLGQALLRRARLCGLGSPKPHSRASAGRPGGNAYLQPVGEGELASRELWDLAGHHLWLTVWCRCCFVPFDVRKLSAGVGLPAAPNGLSVFIFLAVPGVPLPRALARRWVPQRTGFLVGGSGSGEVRDHAVYFYSMLCPSQECASR